MGSRSGTPSNPDPAPGKMLAVPRCRLPATAPPHCCRSGTQVPRGGDRETPRPVPPRRRKRPPSALAVHALANRRKTPPPERSSRCSGPCRPGARCRRRRHACWFVSRRPVRPSNSRCGPQSLPANRLTGRSWGLAAGSKCVNRRPAAVSNSTLPRTVVPRTEGTRRAMRNKRG